MTGRNDFIIFGMDLSMVEERLELIVSQHIIPKKPLAGLQSVLAVVVSGSPTGHQIFISDKRIDVSRFTLEATVVPNTLPVAMVDFVRGLGNRYGVLAVADSESNGAWYHIYYCTADIVVEQKRMT